MWTQTFLPSLVRYPCSNVDGGPKFIKIQFKYLFFLIFREKFTSYSIFSGKGIIKSDHKGLELVAPDIAEDIISVNFLWDVREPMCGVDLGVGFSSCMHSNQSLIRQEQIGHSLPHFILILRCKKKPTSKISPLQFSSSLSMLAEQTSVITNKQKHRLLGLGAILQF